MKRLRFNKYFSLILFSVTWLFCFSSQPVTAQTLSAVNSIGSETTTAKIDKTTSESISKSTSISNDSAEKQQTSTTSQDPATLSSTAGESSQLTEETSTEASASAEENPRSNNESEQTGTQAAPFQVNSVQALTAALKQPLPAGQTTRYLQLTSDLTYTEQNVFAISDNTEIDGQGHTISYNSNDYTRANVGFRIVKSGVQVKMKNLNFGDSQHSNSNMYGMISAGNQKDIAFDLTSENVHYYASQGAQAFYSNNRLSRFYFTGENHFTQLPGNGSQEWLEGNNIIFQKDSRTYIDQQSSPASSSILTAYSSGGATQRDNIVNLTLEENAQVALTTNCLYFLTAGQGLTIDVGKNASFKLNQPTSDFRMTVSQIPTNLNFQAGSYGEFNFGGLLNSAGPINLNLDQPRAILFKKPAATKFFGSTVNVQLNDPNSYGYTYQTANDQALSTETSLRTGASVLSDVALPKLASASKRLLIAGQAKLASLNVVPSVKPGVSQVTATIGQYTPAQFTLRNATFRLSKGSLINGLYRLEDPINQQKIQQAALAYPEQVTTQAVYKNLEPEEYYLYGKADLLPTDDPDQPQFVRTTLWTEWQMFIPKSRMIISVPTELDFKTKQSGAFTSLDQAQPIQNLSNYPVAFTIATVSETGNNPIALKKNFVTHHQELMLNLMTDSGEKLGPLQIGTNQLSEINLPPEATKKIYLQGNYSGPNTGVQQVGFQFNYLVRRK